MKSRLGSRKMKKLRNWAIFVVIVMAFRKGVVGEIAEWWKLRGARPKRTAAQ